MNQLGFQDRLFLAFLFSFMIQDISTSMNNENTDFYQENIHRNEQISVHSRTRLYYHGK